MDTGRSERKLTSTQVGLVATGVALLMVGVPVLGIVLALVYKNAWWLWLLLPLMGFMEGGLVLIGIILFVVGSILGV